MSALKKKETNGPLTDRDQQALETERKILNYLEEKDEPVSFYTLYTDLHFSSGKAQSALKRLQNDKYVFIRKKIDKFKTYVSNNSFDLEPDPLELEDENTIIFPVRLNRVVGAVFQEIPEVSDEHGTFTDIVREALINYFQTQISDDLKQKAIQSAVLKKIISKELGEKILGRAL